MTSLMRPAPLISSREVSRSLALAPGGRAVERKAAIPAALPRIVRLAVGGDDACSFSRRRDGAVVASTSSSFSSSAPASSVSDDQRADAPSFFSTKWPPQDPFLLPQGPAAPFLLSRPSPSEIVAVNFYHLVDLPSARATRKRHEFFLNGKDVRGRIYIAPQGINAQFSAPAAVATEYLIWVKNESEKLGEEGECEDEGGAPPPPPSAARVAAAAAASRSLRETMRANSEPSPGGEHLFPKLRLKYKPNLISLAGGTANLPITDPGARAAPLSPKRWKEMLLQKGDKRPIVLDVRNAYEWDAGHFAGAERPLEDNFCETPTDATARARASVDAGGGQNEDENENENEESDGGDGDEDEDGGLVSSPSSSLDVPAHLASAPKDAPVMMYCTGGIRCDIYSAHLRKKGFTNLYTLEGGVHNYFNQVGGSGWEGSLFVFDARMAVAPRNDEPSPAPSSSSSSSSLSSSSSSSSGASSLSSSSAAASGGEEIEEEEEKQEEGAALPAAAPCLLCGGRASLPHLNCSNIDCNRLFISCRACAAKLSGCCCEACVAAPRLLRPVKVSGYYGTWASEAEELAAAAAGTEGANGQAAAAAAAAAALAAARASMSSGRGSGRLARRRARAERLSRERAAAKEERLRKKAAAKAELARRGGGEGGGRKREDEGESVEDGERAARLAKLEALRSRLLVQR